MTAKFPSSVFMIRSACAMSICALVNKQSIQHVNNKITLFIPDRNRDQRFLIYYINIRAVSDFNYGSLAGNRTHFFQRDRKTLVFMLLPVYTLYVKTEKPS